MEEQPFAELPEALVDELLSKCTPVGEGLFASFDKVRGAREQVRKKLLDLGLLHRDSEISSVPANPTSCGVDGAYAVERLLSTDLAVARALKNTLKN